MNYERVALRCVRASPTCSRRSEQINRARTAADRYIAIAHRRHADLARPEISRCFASRPTRQCSFAIAFRGANCCIGGLGAVGCSLADLLHQPAPAAATPGDAPRGRAKSCIVLFLMGGPSDTATWDPKPKAPLEVRGELGSIPTSVPGLSIGELLPRTATLAEHLCLLPCDFAPATTPIRRAAITC